MVENHFMQGTVNTILEMVCPKISPEHMVIRMTVNLRMTSTPICLISCIFCVLLMGFPTGQNKAHSVKVPFS